MDKKIIKQRRMNEAQRMTTSNEGYQLMKYDIEWMRRRADEGVSVRRQQTEDGIKWMKSSG